MGIESRATWARKEETIAVGAILIDWGCDLKDTQKTGNDNASVAVHLYPKTAGQSV